MGVSRRVWRISSAVRWGPADAISAILRGTHVVVAGDEHQLPLTDFFTGPPADVEAPDLEWRIALDGGFESILDAMLPFIGFRMLSWHCRSWPGQRLGMEPLCAHLRFHPDRVIQVPAAFA
jgi:hypothetical protein